MARITGMIVMLVLPIPAICSGQGYCLSSGYLLQSGADTVAVSSTPAKLCGVIIKADGTNQGEAIVYDDTADNETATKVLFSATVKAGDEIGGAMFPLPIAAMSGLYLDFNGCSGCSAVVYYQP